VRGVFYKGLERSLMVASRPMPAGTVVTINYGRPFVVYQGFHFVELCPEEIESFVQKTKGLKDFYSWGYAEDIRNYMPNFRKFVGESEMPSVDAYVTDMKEYLYEFPDHLFTLVEQKRLDLQALQSFFADCRTSEYMKRLGLDNNHHAELEERLFELESTINGGKT
jgi:hypothetical protein